jgi:beta-glucosidase
MRNRTYRYFRGEPLYPFGYGLSYTRFSYSSARTSAQSIAAADPMKISVDVANDGAMAGDEVVQLYVTHADVKGAPVRALKGVQRIHLGKGEKRSVEFTLRDRDLGIVDEAGKHRIVPGHVDVWIGGGQPVSRTGLAMPAGARTQFTITSEASLPD